MATFRCFYNLVKSSTCPLLQNNLNIINRTQCRSLCTNQLKNIKFLCQVENKIFYSQSSCSDYTTTTRPALEKLDHSIENKKNIGLADELLASKLNVDKSEGKTGEKDEGEEAKEKEDRERAWRAMKFSFVAFGVMMFGGSSMIILTWGAPQCDEEGNSIIDEFSKLPTVKQYFHRAWNECNNMNRMIQEPAREQLLPDPLKEPYIQPSYTLVLEVRDVLVHPEWTYETGWRFKKRPGVDFLLQHCAPPLFEIVIYTNEQGFTAFPLLDHLDPNGYIWYRLFKDSTRYVEGRHVKDLSCLNRDLSKVIMVDWDTDAVSVSRNHLKMPRWDGKMDDKTLVDLGVMLRTIAESEVSDVREVLDYYRSFDNPLEAFKRNQIAAQEQEVLLKQQVEKEGPSLGLASNWTSSFFKKR